MIIIGRHPDPGIHHPQWLENVLTNIVAVRQAGSDSDQLAENEPARMQVVSSPFPGNPARFDRRLADDLDDLVPVIIRKAETCRAEPAGMGQ